MVADDGEIVAGQTAERSWLRLAYILDGNARRLVTVPARETVS
jgi:hypothetical protein